MNMREMQQCLFSGDMQSFDVNKGFKKLFLIKVKGKQEGDYVG